MVEGEETASAGSDDDNATFFSKLYGSFVDLADTQVTIPKRVRLFNPRLNWLHRFLQAATVVFVSIRFVVLRQWTSEKQHGAYVSMAMRQDRILGGMQSNKFHEAFRHAVGSGLCDRSVATCLPICNATQLRSNTVHDGTCVSPFELAAIHSTPRSAFFVTGIVDSNFKNLKDDSDLDQSSQTMFITPYEGALDFVLDYSIVLPYTQSGVHGFSDEITELTSAKKGVRLTTARDISTRVLRDDGSVAALFQPGESMRFTLSDILTLSGQPELLETSAETLRTGHFAGLHVELHVDCKVDLHSRPACDARFYSEKTQAADRVRELPYGSLREYFGVHIESAGTCRYKVADSNEVYKAVVLFLVIWRIPLEIVGVLARFGLGQLSTIYNRVIVENFHIEKTIVGLLLRVMMGQQCFSDMAGDDNVVTARAMASVLRNIFENGGDHLEPDSMASMATLCWKSITSHKTDHDHMCHARFNRALLAQEAIRLEDILGLFCHDRRQSALEATFTPHELRHGERSVFVSTLGRIHTLAFKNFHLRTDSVDESMSRSESQPTLHSQVQEVDLPNRSAANHLAIPSEKDEAVLDLMVPVGKPPEPIVPAGTRPEPTGGRVEEAGNLDVTL